MCTHLGSILWFYLPLLELLQASILKHAMSSALRKSGCQGEGACPVKGEDWEMKRASTFTCISFLLQQGTEMLLAETLNGISFTLVGDDYELTSAVAKNLGQRLGWFSVDTTKVRCGAV